MGLQLIKKDVAAPRLSATLEYNGLSVAFPLRVQTISKLNDQGQNANPIAQVVDAKSQVLRTFTPTNSDMIGEYAVISVSERAQSFATNLTRSAQELTAATTALNEVGVIESKSHTKETITARLGNTVRLWQQKWRQRYAQLTDKLPTAPVSLMTAVLGGALAWVVTHASKGPLGAHGWALYAFVFLLLHSFAMKPVLFLCRKQSRRYYVDGGEILGAMFYSCLIGVGGLLLMTVFHHDAFRPIILAMIPLPLLYYVPLPVWHMLDPVRLPVFCFRFFVNAEGASWLELLTHRMLRIPLRR